MSEQPHTPTPWRPTTPTPWRWEEKNGNVDLFYENNLIGRMWGPPGELRRGNAELLTRCVNAHAALVEACKAALLCLDTSDQTLVLSAIDQLTAALAAAEGE